MKSTKIPKGNERFFTALERLKNAPPNCANRNELAAQCCKHCEKDINCEDCYVQTVGDLSDEYRKKIQKRTKTGMYSSGIYVDGKGNMHYSHPQGSG